ncbi:MULTISPECIES: hypothetical protein [unclassified Sporosarcina]|uniref:hypothetical protein n=1 Tax=unclassified Sporosarcina TaxID=2647733 RepID=UPI0013043FAF|nr:MULTISPECIES: hypothetical protein [unclassified Sporosarcina]
MEKVTFNAHITNMHIFVGDPYSSMTIDYEVNAEIYSKLQDMLMEGKRLEITIHEK